MHRIKQQIIELDFPEEQGASEFQDTVLRIYNQHMISEIEKILSKHAPNDHVITLDVLEIDTGEIAEKDFSHIWPGKVLEQLELVLSRRIYEIDQRPENTGDAIQTVHQNYAEELRYFLRSGMRKWTGQDKTLSAQDLFHYMLTNAASELKELLLEEGGNSRVVKRLAYQFGDKEFVSTVKLIKPIEADFIVETTNSFTKIQQKENILKAEPPAFKTAIKEFVLTYLLNDRGSLFNTKSFVRSVLRQTARRYNVKYISLLDSMLAALPKDKGSNRERRLAVILKDIQKSEKKHTEANTDNLVPIDELLFYLRFGSIGNGRSRKALLSSLKYWWGESEKSQALIKKLLEESVIHEDNYFVLNLTRNQQEFKELVQILNVEKAAYIHQTSEEMASAFSKHLKQSLKWRTFLMRSGLLRSIVLSFRCGFKKKAFEKNFVQFILKQTGGNGIQIPNEIFQSFHQFNKKDLKSQETTDHKSEERPNTIPLRLQDVVEYWSVHKAMPWWVKFKTIPDMWKTLNLIQQKHLIAELFLLKSNVFEDFLLELKENTLLHFVKTSFGVDSENLKKLVHYYFEKATLSQQTFFYTWRIVLNSVIKSSDHRLESILLLVIEQLAQLTGKTNSEILLQLQTIYNNEPPGINNIFFALENILLGHEKSSHSLTNTDQFDLDIFKKGLVSSPNNTAYFLQFYDSSRLDNEILSIEEWHPISQVVHDHIWSIEGYKLQTVFEELQKLAVSAGYVPRDVFKQQLSLTYWLFAEKGDRAYTARFVELLSRLSDTSESSVIGKLLSVSTLTSFESLALTNLKTLSKNGFHEKVVIQEEDMVGPDIFSERDNGDKENIYIHNSGAILLWPFLTQFFTSLELIEENKFKDEDAKNRAVHLIQYLVTGETGFPEYKLVLPKILCGVDLSTPVWKTIDVTKEEEELSKSMLDAIIQHWGTIGKTSIEGFRESFLKRNGVLMEDEKGFVLKAESKAFDVLLDSIPWNISMIQLSWMPKILTVQWR